MQTMGRPGQWISTAGVLCLTLGACKDSATATGDHLPAGTYLLHSVDARALPVVLERPGPRDMVAIVGGQLVVKPDGSFEGGIDVGTARDGIDGFGRVEHLVTTGSFRRQGANVALTATDGRVIRLTLENGALWGEPVAALDSRLAPLGRFEYRMLR